MKYFVVADVHGFYDEMQLALEQAGFDKDNENHCLISLGDATDRGPKPLSVIKFLMELPRAILIRGNHEDLVKECMEGGPNAIDVQNGSLETIRLLAEQAEGNAVSKNWLYADWDYHMDRIKEKGFWKNYYNRTINYFETEHYICVHGWIPCLVNNCDKDIPYSYMFNWRDAGKRDWYEARWASGIKATLNEVFEPNKTIVCGHWHNAAWWTAFDNKPEFSYHHIWKNDKVVACDCCTALSKTIEVFTFEEE